MSAHLFPRMACPKCGRDVRQRNNGAPALHLAADRGARCDGSAFFDAQAPIPFRSGLPSKRMRAAKPGPDVCAKCGCSPFTERCKVMLPDGAGEGACMPAGPGHKFCSACIPVLVALVAALVLACGGAPFTSEGAAADVDAGEVLDGASHPAAADGPELVDAGSGDALTRLDMGSGDVEAGGEASRDAGGEASRELDASSDVGDEPLEHDSDPADAPPACSAPRCPACALSGYVPCCKADSACGCSYAAIGACN